MKEEAYKIDLDNGKAPLCIVWKFKGCLSLLFPFYGEVGITDMEGNGYQSNNVTKYADNFHDVGQWKGVG